MTENDTNKGNFDAKVVGNRKIRARFYKLTLQFAANGANAFGKAKPGQFAQLDLSHTALPDSEEIPENLADSAQREIILRRPYSFCDISLKDGKVIAEVLYCVVGPASVRMTTLKEGDSLGVIGPLGNSFSVPADKKTALLVIGGIGAPPMQHLGKMLSSEHSDMQVVAFVGAKTKADLPFEGRVDEVSKEIGFPIHAFARYGIESRVATDDGSLGFKGPVTKVLDQWLGSNLQQPQEAIIYACGPEAMLAEVARIAGEKNVDCQVSMERRMACGIGICQSCAVECKSAGSNDTVYKLCCKDGPIFNAKEVVFKTEKDKNIL